MLLTYNENQVPKFILVCGNYLIHNKDNRAGVPSNLLGMTVQEDTFIESVGLSEEDSRSGVMSVSMISVDTYPPYIKRDAIFHIYGGYEDDMAYRGPFKIKEVSTVQKVADGVKFTISADRSGDLYEKVGRRVFTNGTYYSAVKSILDGVGRTRVTFLGNSKKILESLSVDETEAIAQAGRTDLALLGELLAYAGLRYADNPNEFVISENESTSTNTWEIEYYTGAKNVRGLTLRFKQRSPRRRREQNNVDDTDPLAECQAELAALRGQSADVLNESALGFDLGDLEGINWADEDAVDQLVARMQPQIDAQVDLVSENIGEVVDGAVEDIDFTDFEFDPSNPVGSMTNFVTQSMQGSTQAILESVQQESTGIVELMNIDPETHQPRFFRQVAPVPGLMTEDPLMSIDPGAQASPRTTEGTTQNAVTGSAGSASMLSRNEVDIDLIFGHMGPKVSDKVIIRGAKYPFDGEYRIKKVAHTYNKSGFNTTLQVQAFYDKTTGASATATTESTAQYDSVMFQPIVDAIEHSSQALDVADFLLDSSETPSVVNEPRVRIVDHRVVYEGFSE